MLEQGIYYTTSGQRWQRILPEDFETILVDFYGRPNGYCSKPLIFVKPDQYAVHIKPKAHRNRIGLTRDINGKFYQTRWRSFKDHFI